MATLIDGRALAKEVNAHTKQRIEKLKEKGVTPGIATILVGDDPASRIYVRNKQKAAEKVGIVSTIIEYSDDVFPYLLNVYGMK